MVRRCLRIKPHHYHLIGKCTNDKQLLRIFVSVAFDTRKGGIRANTAIGTLCFCKTNECNHYPLEILKNYPLTTDSQGTTSQTTEINEQTEVSTVDSPTTRGIAAEQVKYNNILFITITCILSLVYHLII